MHQGVLDLALLIKIERYVELNHLKADLWPKYFPISLTWTSILTPLTKWSQQKRLKSCENGSVFVLKHIFIMPFLCVYSWQNTLMELNTLST